MLIWCKMCRGLLLKTTLHDCYLLLIVLVSSELINGPWLVFSYIHRSCFKNHLEAKESHQVIPSSYIFNSLLRVSGSTEFEYSYKHNLESAHNNPQDSNHYKIII